jgi:hypothetical protein
MKKSLSFLIFFFLSMGFAFAEGAYDQSSNSSTPQMDQNEGFAVNPPFWIIDIWYLMMDEVLYHYEFTENDYITASGSTRFSETIAEFGQEISANSYKVFTRNKGSNDFFVQEFFRYTVDSKNVKSMRSVIYDSDGIKTGEVTFIGASPGE